ncbi:hypothetical protein EV183_002562 [Coemansia sp. RSA 2336]|nr:hypothetical protein EV183_002562 [Coemansia sp. RSA 2336]
MRGVAGIAARQSVLAKSCSRTTLQLVRQASSAASSVPSNDEPDAANPVSKAGKRRHLVFNNRTGPSLHHFLAQPLGKGAADASAATPEEIPYMQVTDWGQGRKYYVEVYGCQMNVNDTEILMAVLNKSGYQRTMVLEDADVIFLMTCAIREKAEDRIWSRLTFLKSLKTKSDRAPMVGVLGCMAERLKEKLLDSDKLVDVVCGPDAYRSLPRLLSLRSTSADGVANVMLSADETYADITPVRLDANKISVHLSIMRGCNNMCSFCIVPFTRGTERSRDIDSIVREVRGLSRQGIREVTLLGQNVNSYRDTSQSSSYDTQGYGADLSRGFSTIYRRKEGGRRFAELLHRVAQVDPEMRVRFTSPHPKDFPDELLYVIRDNPNVCRNIHLPLQSGSTSCLERMRRGYSREAFLELVQHIRQIIPDVTFSTDVIAGFCGETEAEHQDTVSVMRTVGFDMAFMFAYSMRERTHAHRKFQDDVPSAVKTRRLQEIIEAFHSTARERNQRFVGTQGLVLYEGLTRRHGRPFGSDDYGHKVFLDSPGLADLQPGDYVRVRIDSATSASLTANARQYAIQRLAKLLRHPDDLTYRAEDLRRKLAQEKLLIDAQLNTDVRRQFDDVQEGLELLYSTSSQIGRVKTDMQKVDELCHRAQSYLTNFDRIQQISTANRNFAKADDFYRQFSEFHQQHTHVREMLADAQANFDQGNFNLLRLHYFLYKLEDFRNSALGFTDVDIDSKQTLNRMFSGLDSLVREFEDFLWMVAGSMYDLALRNRSNVIVHLLKVVEFEEAADRAQQREREGAAAAAAAAAPLSPVPSGNKAERTPKHYKKKLLEFIHTFVSSRVSEFFSQEAGGLEGITEVTGFVVDELTFVGDAVAPAFPASYYIFDVFVDEYHRSVVENTNTLASGDLDGGSILLLLRWVREYHGAIRKELSIPKDQLRPALLEGREDQLAQEYLEIASGKIREWISNLMRTENESFVSRQDAPNMGEDGLYVTGGSIYLFEIVNQNIELVTEAQRAKLLCDLMVECNKIFQDISKQWRELLEKEKTKQIEAPETAAEGLVDYTMALANEQIRSVVQAETIRDETGERLTRTHQERFKSELSQTMDIFMGVAEAATQTLADIVFSDLRPITSVLFTSEWYQDDLLQPVIETLKDYCQDFHDHLDKYLYRRLMQDLLSRFALSYVDAIAGKVKLLKGKASEKLNLEMHRASKFFKEHMDSAAVSETLNIVRILISLIDSTPAMIFLEFFSVKKQYPDLPLALIEDILSKRDDLEKQQLKTILESLRQKAKGDTGSSLAKQRTLFSKLKNYTPLGNAAKGRFL